MKEVDNNLQQDNNKDLQEEIVGMLNKSEDLQMVMACRTIKDDKELITKLNGVLLELKEFLAKS